MAVLVPDAEILEKYARDNQIPGDMVELSKKKVDWIDFCIQKNYLIVFQEIKELILNDLKQLEKSNSLKGFEMVINHLIKFLLKIFL